MNVKDSRAIFRMDIGFFAGTMLWALLKSLYRIYVLCTSSGLTRNSDSSSHELGCLLRLGEWNWVCFGEDMDMSACTWESK